MSVTLSEADIVDALEPGEPLSACGIVAAADVETTLEERQVAVTRTFARLVLFEEWEVAEFEGDDQPDVTTRATLTDSARRLFVDGGETA